MVTIKDYAVATNSTSGELFVSLILEGDLELILSQQSGRFYATTRRCSISSTFDESTAAIMVGKQIPGNIQKKECEPYDYTITDTGEVIKLSHRYEYVPEEVQPSPEQVSPENDALVEELNEFSTNGQQMLAEA